MVFYRADLEARAQHGKKGGVLEWCSIRKRSQTEKVNIATWLVIGVYENCMNN